MADPTVSVGNVHTLTAVGDSDSFLFLSLSFLSLHILPRSPCPLIGEFWQGATASSCHLSVCLPLMSKRGDMRIYYNGQMVQRAKEKSVSYDLSLLSLLFPACCLIRSARSVLVPVQCLIDAAELPSSSLSMRCSSPTLSDGVAAIKPQGLSASQGYLN